MVANLYPVHCLLARLKMSRDLASEYCLFMEANLSEVWIGTLLWFNQKAGFVILGLLMYKDFPVFSEGRGVERFLARG